jgi:hypothetical protein
MTIPRLAYLALAKLADELSKRGVEIKHEMTRADLIVDGRSVEGATVLGVTVFKLDLDGAVMRRGVLAAAIQAIAQAIVEKRLVCVLPTIQEIPAGSVDALWCSVRFPLDHQNTAARGVGLTVVDMGNFFDIRVMGKAA